MIQFHIKMESLQNVFLNELFKVDGKREYVVLAWFLKRFEKQIPSLVLRVMIDELVNKEIIKLGTETNPHYTGHNNYNVTTIALNKEHKDYEKMKAKANVLITVAVGSDSNTIEVDGQ